MYIYIYTMYYADTMLWTLTVLYTTASRVIYVTSSRLTVIPFWMLCFVFVCVNT